jgi:dihydroorotate dehydrogenase (fumarate)
MGLPNNGVKYYLECAQNIDNPLHKPFFLSVCGLSVEENLDILKTVTTFHNSNFFVNGIELNLSCPNIVGKPQLGKRFTLIHEKSK